MIDHAWPQGATAPVHPVSSTGQVLGWDGWSEARRLLASGSVAEGQRWARRVVALTGGQAEYWCRKALRQGLRHVLLVAV